MSVCVLNQSHIRNKATFTSSYVNFFLSTLKLNYVLLANATISQIHWDGISFIYVTKRKAPRIDLCGMPIISIDPEVQMEIHFVVLEC